MIKEELLEKLNEIQITRCETQILNVIFFSDGIIKTEK